METYESLGGLSATTKSLSQGSRPRVCCRESLAGCLWSPEAWLCRGDVFGGCHHLLATLKLVATSFLVRSWFLPPSRRQVRPSSSPHRIRCTSHRKG